MYDPETRLLGRALERAPKGLSSMGGRDSELGVEACSEKSDVDASYPPPA
jgi:hypothetical protein